MSSKIMFYILLITITVGNVLCVPGLESVSGTATASFGFGAVGGFNYERDQRPHVSYTPQHYAVNNRGFTNVYVPGRPNPFIPYVRASRFLEDSSGMKMFPISSYRNSIPETYVYQQYQTCNNPAFSSFASVTESPYTDYIPYRMPYFKIIETYKFYSPSREIKNNEERKSGFNLGSEMDANNKMINEAIKSTSREESIYEDTTLNEKPSLQLTYLGFVPQSSFRSNIQSLSVDDDKQKIPFYILEHNDEYSRSSSSSPPLYISPTRLPTAVYPSMDIAYPGLHASVQGAPSPLGPAASQYRDATNDRPGYYLFDVNPMGRANGRPFTEPLLGMPQPTFPMIQTLTGPMGGPITDLIRPSAQVINPGTQLNIGSQKSGENVNRVENKNFKNGYQIQLPIGHGYGDEQSNKEVSVQNYDGAEHQSINSGFNGYSFETPGLLE